MTSALSPAAVPAPRSAAERRRMLGGLVALGRERFRRSGGARGAAVLAGIATVVFASMLIAVRVSDGGDAPMGSVVARAARIVGWLAGVPLALSAARDRLASDRADGIDALVASRGFSSLALDSARALGAMLQASIVIAFPLTSIAVLSVALAGSVRVALARASLVAGALAFAIVAGVTLGGLGALCGRVGGRRGRWVLAAVVLLPWMIAAELGHASWSIPGALDAVRRFVLPSLSRIA